MTIRPRLAHCASLLAIASAPLPAWAQSAPVPAPVPVAVPEAARDEDQDTTGDIIVTAQKRSENLQDVPLSVLAVDGDLLRERNVTSLTDIQTITPGISVRSFYTNISGSINVRGVGTQALTVPTVEQTVSVVSDGVTVGTFSGALFNFPDIERVEVLRGPQGTLFGKGASNGLINLVSRAPSDRLSGSVGASYGTLNEVKLRGTISGPLAQGVSARISGYRNTRDGFGRAILPDGSEIRVNNVNEWGVRGQLLIEPTNELSIRLFADYSRTDSRCCVAFQTIANVPADPATAAALGLPVGYPLPFRGAELDESSRTNFGNESRDVAELITGRGVTAQIDYSLGGVTLTSITGWRRTELDGNSPGDLTPFDIFVAAQNRFSFEQVSEELRITTPAEDFIAFQGGLFYFGSKLKLRQSLSLFAAPPIYRTDVDSEATDDNYAVFGQATVNATDRLRFILGGRYTYDEQALQFRNLLSPTFLVANPLAGFFAAAGLPFFATPFVAPRVFQANDFDIGFSDSAFSYKVGAQFDLTDDINVFGTYSRGFKSGGFLTDPNAIQNPANSIVRPEIPKGFELGVRSQFFNRRLTINATYFDYRFDGLQSSSFIPELGTFLLVNQNAETRGVELEVLARPTDSTRISFNGAYTDATFRGGSFDQCFPGQTLAEGCTLPGGRQNLEGRRLPDAPRYTFTANLRQELPLSGTEIRPYADVSYFFRSGANLQASGGPQNFEPRYGRLDATIGTSIPMRFGELNLRAYARNLAKTNYATNRLSVPQTGYWAAQLVAYESGRRVFGVAADLTF